MPPSATPPPSQPAAPRSDGRAAAPPAPELPPPTRPPPDNLLLDDLVRLPNDHLAFLDRLPGHESDTESDETDDDDEDSSDDEAIADPRGRVTRLLPHIHGMTQPHPAHPGLAHAHAPHNPTTRAAARGAPPLISTYDDATDPAADAHDDETPVVPHTRHQPVPEGYALVTHAFSAAQSVVEAGALAPVDRSFDPGSLVLPVDRPAGAQSGLVERVRKTLVVRRVTDIEPGAALRPDPAHCFEVPAEALGFFSGLRSGDTVVRGPWVGVVDHFQEDVYVEFRDGAIACVPGHKRALQNIDPRTPEHAKPDPFSEGLYYPGQRVKSLPEVWRSIANWIRGRYTGINDGVVKSVSVGDVGVEWVAKSMYSNSPDEIPMSVEERNVEVVRFSDITALEAFRPMWWTVGDRGFLINPANPSDPAAAANAIAEDEEDEDEEGDGDEADDDDDVVAEDIDSDDVDSDGDGEWVEELSVDEGEYEEYDGTDSQTRSRSASRAGSRSRGRLMQAQRRARERSGVGENNDMSIIDLALATPSTNPQDVVQIVGTKTFIDVLWQDGTREENQPSLRFRRHMHPDPYDFWPGELVRSTAEDLDDDGDDANGSDGAARDGAQNGDTGNGRDGQANGGTNAGVEKRKGALMRMNHAERTAVVRWMDPETDELQEEEEVSAYELQGDEFDVGIGDTVLHAPSANSTERRKEWVGVVVGQRNGKCTVAWYGGTVTDVPYKELLLFMQDEEEEGSEDSGMSTDAESEEEEGQAWDGPDGPNGHGAQDSDMQHNWGTDEEDDAPVVDDVIAQGRLYMSQMCSNAASQGLSVNSSEGPVGAACKVAVVTARNKLREFVARRERVGGERVLLTTEEGRILGGLMFSSAFNEILSLSLSEAASGGLKSADPTDTRMQWSVIEDFLSTHFRKLVRQADSGQLAEEPGDTEPASSERTVAAPSKAEPTPVAGTAGASDTAGVEEEDKPGMEDKAVKAEEKGDERDMDVSSGDIEKFDICEELNDFHSFPNAAASGSSAPNVGFMSVVNREWRRLKKSLPAGIIVRASESQNQRLRAAIIGPKDTPYADVIFFFDIQMGPRYPMEPPLVWFHSHGRRLNPNLYEDGKVCLSILGTWDGDDVESWDPKNSNLLRVLLSLQALVFVEDPYFNEAGYQKQRGTEEGRINSQTYNESAFLLSMRHALQTMRNAAAPADCVAIARAHYRAVGHNLIAQCKALVAAQPAGSSDGAAGKAAASSEVKAEFMQYCSAGFKRSLSQLVAPLERALAAIMRDDS